jgi:hypothetical protein
MGWQETLAQCNVVITKDWASYYLQPMASEQAVRATNPAERSTAKVDTPGALMTQASVDQETPALQAIP